MLRANEKLILALPKGRILAEVMPVVRLAGIEPEPAFDDDDDRRLRLATNLPEVDIIRVRSIGCLRINASIRLNSRPENLFGSVISQLRTSETVENPL